MIAINNILYKLTHTCTLSSQIHNDINTDDDDQEINNHFMTDIFNISTYITRAERIREIKYIAKESLTNEEALFVKLSIGDFVYNKLFIAIGISSYNPYTETFYFDIIDTDYSFDEISLKHIDGDLWQIRDPFMNRTNIFIHNIPNN